MGSFRRKLHNDCVIMTETKMKTKLPSKKSREEETMTLSTASALLSIYLKHVEAAAEEQRLRTSLWIDT